MKLYFHGLPGGAEELALAGVSLPVVARRGEHESALAARLLTESAGKPLHLVGFSLGAALVLRLAPLLRPERIDLIVPAAPLELGNFLPEMAGAPVFRAARLPLALRSLTAVQRLAFAVAPENALRALFATAPPADKALLTSEQNRAHLLAAIRHSLGPNRAAYLAEITRYVSPWAQILPAVACPVTIWQGEADTWAPPAMARALVQVLPQATLHLLPGLGHYSSLCHALPRIADQDL